MIPPANGESSERGWFPPDGAGHGADDETHSDGEHQHGERRFPYHWPKQTAFQRHAEAGHDQ